MNITDLECLGKIIRILKKGDLETKKSRIKSVIMLHKYLKPGRLAEDQALPAKIEQFKDILLINTGLLNGNKTPAIRPPLCRICWWDLPLRMVHLFF